MNEFEIITHIHTDASSGAASVLDRLITEGSRTIFGPAYKSRWKECFNTPADVCSTLRPNGTVSMVFMTDHINENLYRLNREAIALASQDSRIAVGAEIQTYYRHEKENILRAPEILVYGRYEPNRAGDGSFYGLSQEDLDILFRECAIDATGRADIIMVRDYCILNGYAHALAHPFDGSQLGIPQLLDVITGFKFVETVNGGFPADSSKRLSRFISWYNKAADGLIPEEGLSSDLLRSMCRKAIALGPVHPWGGSDAHAQNHDRVVVLYRTEKDQPSPGDLFSDMVTKSVRELLALRTFSISGTPSSPIRLLDDVTRIAYQNVLSHMDLINDTPLLLELLAKLQRITKNEIRQRRSMKKMLIADFDKSIGREILLGLTQVRRQQWRRKLPDHVDPSYLPERIP